MIGEISTLAHEIRNNSVKRGIFEAETFFSGAKGTEIFSCLRYDILVELKFYALRGFLTDLNVKEYNRIRGIAEFMAGFFYVFIIVLAK